MKNQNFYEKSKEFELDKQKNYKKSKDEGVYFTPEYVVIHMLQQLKIINKENIKILEPSVGSGNFLPGIINFFSDKFKKIDLFINDIDNNSLEFIKDSIKNNLLVIPENITIHYINKDYLIDDFSEFGEFDYIIGNPPYGKIQNLNIKKIFKNKKTNNMFSFFIEKSVLLGNNISFIVPKSLLFVKQFKFNRTELCNGIYEISDYGKTAFDVNLETVSFSYTKKHTFDTVLINDKVNNQSFVKNNNYVFDKNFPIWLLYRDDFFDEILNGLNIDIFKVFRDRQITNKILLDKGDIQCLKGKNIGKNTIINIKDYDQFVQSVEGLKSGIYLNKENVLCLPNLTGSIRTCMLPKNTITNGAVALIHKQDFSEINQETIDFINSDIFKKYFFIIKNKSNLSVNLDENIIYFFGEKK